MNIAMLLQMASESCPDRKAITYERKSYNYQELFNAAKTAATKIQASSCTSVSVLDTNSPAIPIAIIGAAIAGVPYVPLNYRLTGTELDALIERISPTFLVYGHQYKGAVRKETAMSSEQFLTESLTLKVPDQTWSEDPQKIAVQLFTSGTTGTPKAAILRHEHIISYILSSVEFLGANENEATLMSVPPYHIAGIAAILSSIYACRRIVQLPDFNPESWLNLCDQENVTNAFVVPTMLTRIVDLVESAHKPPPKALKALAYGGGKMPLKVIEKALTLLPEVNFTNAYGLTETSSTVTLLGPEDHRKALNTTDPEAKKRLTSVGKPLPSIELEIRNENNEILKANQVGEIYIKGPQVSGEYQEKSLVNEQGWFPTKDSGYLDNEGYLYLSGRSDDIIVRGGENISPGEIEDVLLAHPKIIDAAVVGIPSAEWGESVAAAVSSTDKDLKEKELQELVRRTLRSSRVPEKIIFEPELPYNETGKLLRRVVRELFH